MRRLRIGVIGAGHLGRIHARILSKLEGARLMGVADPSPEAREQVAGMVRTATFADHQELLPMIDAAVIAAPTYLHHQLGLELIAAGKHVLIEKPLAPTFTQAKELTAAARQAGVVLQVGHVERFNPALTAAAPITRNPKFIDAVRYGGFSGRSMDVGVVMDLMIHDLDLILSMNPSAVRHVDALGVAVVGEHEDMANARLTFEGGCVANVSASRICLSGSRRMHVLSDAGFARLDFAARNATLVQPSEELRSRQFDLETIPVAARGDAVREALAEDTVTPEPTDQLTEELAEFVTCIRSGASPRCDGAQASRAVEVAELILSKISEHQWDGKPEGPTGPAAMAAPVVLRGPHWNRATNPADQQDAAAIDQREAG